MADAFYIKRRVIQPVNGLSIHGKHFESSPSFKKIRNDHHHNEHMTFTKKSYHQSSFIDKTHVQESILSKLNNESLYKTPTKNISWKVDHHHQQEQHQLEQQPQHQSEQQIDQIEQEQSKQQEETSIKLKSLQEYLYSTNQLFSNSSNKASGSSKHINDMLQKGFTFKDDLDNKLICNSYSRSILKLNEKSLTRAQSPYIVENSRVTKLIQKSESAKKLDEPFSQAYIHPIFIIKKIKQTPLPEIGPLNLTHTQYYKDHKILSISRSDSCISRPKTRMNVATTTENNENNMAVVSVSNINANIKAEYSGIHRKPKILNPISMMRKQTRNLNSADMRQLNDNFKSIFNITTTKSNRKTKSVFFNNQD